MRAMFQLFRGTPSGTHTIAVNEGTEIAMYVRQAGQKPSMPEYLYICGLYTAKALYVVKHPEFTDLTFTMLSHVISRLEESGSENLLESYDWTYSERAFNTTSPISQMPVNYWLARDNAAPPRMDVKLANINPKHLLISILAYYQSYVRAFRIHENPVRAQLFIAFWDSFLA